MYLGAIGLEVNSAKCELTILGHADVDPYLSQFREVSPDVRLVGAPVVSSAIPPILAEKMVGLVSRLQVVDSHQAFVLLRNTFSIPKLSYMLRASPAY